MRVGAHGFVQATFLTGYDGTRAVYDSYRRGWREAGRGHDVPIDRLAYAALVYVGDSEAEARAGAEKMLWYISANKVPPHFSIPPGYAPPQAFARIMRGDVGDQHANFSARATVDGCDQCRPDDGRNAGSGLCADPKNATITSAASDTS